MSEVLTLGCTYILDIELDDHSVDLFTAPFIYVTLTQGTLQKTFTTDHIELHSRYELSILLSQENSLAFSPGVVKIQVNWLEQHGADYYRRSTDIAAFVLDKQLFRRTLPLSSEVTP